VSRAARVDSEAGNAKADLQQDGISRSRAPELGEDVGVLACWRGCTVEAADEYLGGMEIQESSAEMERRRVKAQAGWMDPR
jgi:hypothetical protein